MLWLTERINALVQPNIRISRKGNASRDDHCPTRLKFSMITRHCPFAHFSQSASPWSRALVTLRVSAVYVTRRSGACTRTLGVERKIPLHHFPAAFGNARCSHNSIDLGGAPSHKAARAKKGVQFGKPMNPSVGQLEGMMTIRGDRRYYL
jgi:hypothetical protein